MTYQRTLATSFITTVAAVATAALAWTSGCSGEVFSNCEGCGGANASSSSTSTSGSCPASLPPAGGACSDEGLQCTYGDPICEPSAVCDGGSWTIIPSGECNPPPCPVEQPMFGDSCAGFLAGDLCYYDSQFCPGETVQAWCQDNGEWQVDEVFCNPPPPDYCYSLIDPTSCLQEPFCDWQVPGCGEPALPAASCHPIGYDCSIESICAADQLCAQVWVDPCWDSNCGACGELSWLCVSATESGSDG